MANGNVLKEINAVQLMANQNVVIVGKNVSKYQDQNQKDINVNEKYILFNNYKCF